MRSTDELRALVEDALADWHPHGDLGPELVEAIAYSLDGGGKRVRPVLCLAVAEAVGRPVDERLPAALALELVHTFSLVHDDLPSLDDDDVRRGRPSTWAKFGEDVALLTGDALLAEAVWLAASYPKPEIARIVSEATLRMIAGQHRELVGDDVTRVRRLKTGALFDAAVGCGVSGVEDPREHASWSSFAESVGALFQLVDDLLDDDGSVGAVGADETRRRADQAADAALTALAALERLDRNTGVLQSFVEGLAARTA